MATYFKPYVRRLSGSQSITTRNGTYSSNVYTAGSNKYALVHIKGWVTRSIESVSVDLTIRAYNSANSVGLFNNVISYEAPRAKIPLNSHFDSYGVVIIEPGSSLTILLSAASSQYFFGEFSWTIYEFET